MTTSIIEAQSITKIYTTGENSVKAVDDISFKVHTGEFVALVGPSGSGKTTMLAMLAVLLNPTDGKIIIDGVNLNKLKEHERIKFRHEKIGFAFQSHNLIPYLTIEENVELMLRLNGKTSKQDRSYVKELLGQMGLSERLNYLPNQVSGGQRQRAAIARAVVHNPRMILADEPTANLDTERAYQAVKIFADLIHNQDRCGIMVTHDLRMCRFVDKVILMEDGKLVRVIENSQDIEEFAHGH